MKCFFADHTLQKLCDDLPLNFRVLWRILGYVETPQRPNRCSGQKEQHSVTKLPWRGDDNEKEPCPEGVTSATWLARRLKAAVDRDMLSSSSGAALPPGRAGPAAEVAVVVSGVARWPSGRGRSEGFGVAPAAVALPPQPSAGGGGGGGTTTGTCCPVFANPGAGTWP